MLEAGLNRFTLSVKKWTEKTNGIGLMAKTGRFSSGTYAHKDIAFEFGSWLSPEFKFYLIKEFQRLKDEESSTKPKRSWLLDRLNPEQGFFRLCTSYDSFTLVVVDGFKGMDKGESESYAQFKKLSAQLIISDDKAFTKALGELDRGIKVYTTLHLICWLDVLNYLLVDWNSIVKKVHTVRPFRSSDLRSAYEDILLKLGIDMPNKKLSKKCSLKEILSP